MSHIDWLQWGATVVTVAAAWFTGSSRQGRRRIGFWTFLVSNLLWGTWGVQHSAWALLTLQIALASMNIRGAMRNSEDANSA